MLFVVVTRDILCLTVCLSDSDFSLRRCQSWLFRFSLKSAAALKNEVSGNRYSFCQLSYFMSLGIPLSLSVTIFLHLCNFIDDTYSTYMYSYIYTTMFMMLYVKMTSLDQARCLNSLGPCRWKQLSAIWSSSSHTCANFLFTPCCIFANTGI